MLDQKDWELIRNNIKNIFDKNENINFVKIF